MVYKITNVLSGRFYVGVHKTSNPNDDYMGSGIEIRKVLKNEGRQNFKKEILESFEHERDAFKLEVKLVTSALIRSGAVYNRMVGGKGGWETFNSSGEKKKAVLKGALKTALTSRIKMSEIISAGLKQSYLTRSHCVGWAVTGNMRAGTTHTQATKLKMSAAKIGKQTTGTLGKVWIHSIIQRKSVLVERFNLDSFFIRGWILGRKIKF